MEGVTKIDAYQCSDGFKTFSKEEATKRQEIINRGGKVCWDCKGKGVVFVSSPGVMGGYDMPCSICKSKGFLVKKTVWE